jgi:hypothetical protein
VSKEVIAVPGVTEPIESTSLRATLDFYSQDEDPSKALPLGVFTSGSYLPDTGSFGLQGGNISLSGQFENGVIDAIVSAPFSSTELHVERMSSY